ncbi:hypothetical protein DID88_000701 [Monilinia fructigena]|uniref:Cation/H+ exchanger transmembrane domain-containing protein n=1 Tax=Monilinia fructigena TaxID=38457 RepID=A0A395IIL6_9HELO|nr:hypothetical protein DID88_000701 [Monilinia fructigena]
MSAAIAGSVFELLRRQSEEEDPDALFTSYLLQIKKVEAVHETSISIFAGMTIGLILRVSAGNSIQSLVSFDDQIFFNLLLPPIILASGYELHQANFFRNIGTILTFAFAGNFHLSNCIRIGTLVIYKNSA